MGDDPLFEELRRRVGAELVRLKVPGAVLGVWSQARESVACFGVTSLENPLPVDASTLFQVGSITKTMTATALMRLAGEGRLDLDRPLKELMPGFAMRDGEVTARATARHLLTHTGGWVGDYFDDFGSGDEALGRMVLAIGRLEQVTPLGEFWSYNNAGFNIASRLLEVLTGLPYEEALKALVLSPLGLGQTLFYPSDELMTRRFVVGHQKWDDGVRVARPWAIGRAGNGVGGAVASAGDLLAYARFHLSSGLLPSGGRLMSAAAVDAMREVQADAGARGLMGLSWFLRDYGDLRICCHGGATKGQEAILFFAPGRDFALALLTNSGAGGIVTDQVVAWAAELWFGARKAAPRLRSASAAELGAYAGRYELPLSAFELEAREDSVILREIPRGGFPRPDTPPGPADPPLRALACEGDALIVQDEPRKDAVAEFFRGADGAVRYCRIGGRVHVKTG
jgi:CubicO group peptidase (beta-lactamase class C family)